MEFVAILTSILPFAETSGIWICVVLSALTWRDVIHLRQRVDKVEEKI